MSVPKKLALIALGYVLALLAGCGAVTVNELLMPSDISQGSPGMVAFGDMILFVLVAGFVGLIPTLFLLRLAIEKVPRASLVVLAVAALAKCSVPRHLKVVGRKEGLPELERLEIVLARSSRSKTKPCEVLAELIHDTLVLK